MKIFCQSQMEHGPHGVCPGNRRLGKGDLNLPFEPVPPGQTIDLEEATQFAGGLVVMAAAVPVPGVGTRPALIFRFVEPDGVFHHPLVLVCEPDELLALERLVGQNARAAIRAAG